MKILLLQKMAGVSGSETYFLNLLPRLRLKGIDTHFLIVQHPANAEKNRKFVAELEAGGVTIHVIESRLSISPWLLWRIHKLIRTQVFDLVQTNLIHADVWGACIKKFLNPKMRLISVKHGYGEEYQRKYGMDPSHLTPDLMFRLTKWAAKYADSVISISSGLNRLLVKGGMVASQRAAVIPYGFDFSHVPAHPAPGSRRVGNPQIVVVGRLVPVKQHHLLLETIPTLARKFPDLAVVIVGAGPLQGELANLAESLGIESNVRFEGFKTNVHDYIEDSDLMVVPSSAEGFGLVVLESWFHAKPVVAFDVPALNEVIVDGESGILVKPFDTEELGSKLTEVLADKAYCQQLGNRGRVMQRELFSLDVMCSSTMAAYQRVSTN